MYRKAKQRFEVIERLNERLLPRPPSFFFEVHFDFLGVRFRAVFYSELVGEVTHSHFTSIDTTIERFPDEEWRISSMGIGIQ